MKTVFTALVALLTLTAGVAAVSAAPVVPCMAATGTAYTLAVHRLAARDMRS